MDTRRMLAGAIDFFIAAIIQAVLMASFVIRPMIKESILSEEIIPLTVILTFISLLYLILRDNLGNKSLGKKVMRLKILDISTNDSTSFLQRLLRNVTWILGPIEIVFFLISGTRFGEKISKTKVVNEDG